MDKYNKLEKWLFPKIWGHKFDHRFKWGEMYFSGDCYSRFEICFQRDQIFEHDLFCVKLPFFKLYIHRNKPKELENDYDNNQAFMYGFYFYGTRMGELKIGWGKEKDKKSVYLQMPWSWDWWSREVLDYDFNTVHKETKKDRRDYFANYDKVQEIKKSVSKEYPYRYVLKNGTIQDRIATVFVERLTWKMKWFPFIKKVHTSIDVAFDGEVGERTGSWKGGTIGCGYDLLPNETPEPCLRRMERERKF